MRVIFILAAVYALLLNLISFLMMGADKKKAQRGEWRISEASLFLVALLGGSIGSICGMKHFRHKTKHWYFRYGMPAILAAQLFLLVLFFFYCRL